MDATQDQARDWMPPLRPTRSLFACLHRLPAILLLSACGSGTGPVAPTHPAGTITASAAVTARPFGIAASLTGVVYVSRLDARSLARFDLPGTSRTAAVVVGSVPTAVTFNSTGATAYVANQFSQSAGVVDVVTNAQRASIPVTGDPCRVLAAPDDRTLFVSTNVDTLYRVDLTTQAVVARIGFPDLPNGLAFNAGATLLYASTIAGTVTEIGLASNTARRTFSIGGKLQGVAVSPDGSELYVADESGVRLLFVSVATGAVVDERPLAGGGFDLQLTPDGAQIYVSESESGTVEVFDRASHALVVTIETGGTPRRIAFERSGGTAVIANEAGWVDFVN